MTLANAIKKLERNGFMVAPWAHDTAETFNKRFTAKHTTWRHYIEIMTQGEDVIIIDLRTPGQEDDSMTDYHAGTFCDSITQAIDLARE